MKYEKNAKYNSVNASRYVDENEKNIEWGISLMNNVMNFAGSANTTWGSVRASAAENWRRYAGVIEEKQIEYLVKPHGERISTPYKRFPVSRSRIDQIISEFVLTPPKRHVMQVDKESIDQRENAKIQMHLRQATAKMDEELEKIMGQQISHNQNVQLVNNVEDFFEKGNYKEHWAKQINLGMDYMFNVENLMEPIKQGLLQHLVTGRPLFEMKIKSGNPWPYPIDSRSAIYELGSDSDHIGDNCHWFYYEYWATLGQIKNEFRDCPEFQGKNGKELLKKLEAHSRGNGSATTISFPMGTNFDFWYRKDTESGAVIKVARYFWMSSKDVAIKQTRTKTGNEMIVSINPKQRVKSYEKKMIKPVDDPWQITCLGGIEYIDFKRCEKYTNDVDDEGKHPLPIIGLHMGKTTGFTTSMQDLLNPIDEMYDEVMFHIRATLARAGGKVILYDVSQMPGSFGKNIQKLAHHMKQDGIIAVDMSNVDEEKAAGLGSSFNQWKELDLSIKQELTQLVNLRLMLEQMADDISGVNDNRRGNINQYETSGNAQESITRSATRTEAFLYPFNQMLKRLYERMADMMKNAWKEGKSYAFWNPNGSQVMLKMLPDVALHNYGFYVGSSVQDRRYKDQIESLMMQLSSNSQDPDLLLGMVKIMNVDYADEAQAIFESAIEVMKANNERMREMESEQANKMAGLKEKELADKERQHKEKMQNAIDIANIQVGGKVVVADILTDQVEMKERAGLLKAGKESSENDSKPDQSSEKTGKSRMAKQMAKNQI